MTQDSSHSNTTQAQLRYLQALFSTAIKYRAVWVLPIVMAGLVGVMIAFFGPKQWEATQAFLVREELIGRIVGPGRFESLDTMKTAQETIQEVSRRPTVIRRVLQKLGPSSGTAGSDWPHEADIESVQGSISFYAPGGAELGKTEVLIMKVTASSRDRAREMAQALFDETQAELRRVRTTRAASMEQEMDVAAELARKRLQTAAEKVEKIEAKVGADLSELRSLNETTGGGSELRRMDAQIQTELRAALADLESKQKQKETLAVAQNDPSMLVATPRELLDLQPALAGLKDKLIDAQAEQSAVRGRYNEIHPAAEAARFAVDDMKRQIVTELFNAQRGLETQITLAFAKIKSLRNKSASIDQRLIDLAQIRVVYSQTVDEMQQCRDELQQVQRELSQATSIREVANAVNLITRVDDAQAATTPVGPTKKTFVAGCLAAGFMIGLGLVVLLTPTSDRTRPTPPSSSQRASSPSPTPSPLVTSNVAIASQESPADSPTSADPISDSSQSIVSQPDFSATDMDQPLNSTPFVLPDINPDLTQPPPDAQES